MENAFPFQLIEDNNQFTIIAPIESRELLDKYNLIFEKYGYSGNGYSWEGHIIQILEKTDAELLEQIDFDPEAGGFFAYADTKEVMVRFSEVVSPIFSDLKLLESYLSSAERDRVDD